MTESVGFGRLSRAAKRRYPAEDLAKHAEQIGRNWLARICSLKRIDMAHRTRQIALFKAMISLTEMAVFGGGYFPIENDLGQKGKSKTNYNDSKR